MVVNMKNKLGLSELEKKLYRIKVKQIRNDKIYLNGVVSRPRYYAETMAHQSAKLYINAFRQYNKYPEGHPLKQEFNEYL